MPISALPTPPSRQDPTNFNDRADAFLGALPQFQSEANTLQTDVNASQLAATYSATLAAASELAAANTAGATIWVSGTTYAIGANRFSPINFRTYRRKTAGAGTTDPSTDSTNWQLLTSLGDVLTTGDQSIAGVKTFTGRVLVPSGSAAAPSVAFSADGSTDTGFYWVSDGTTGFTNNGVSSGTITAGGNLTMVGNITAYSDERLKTDWKVIPDNFIYDLSKIKYGTYTRTDTGERQVGTSAQDWQKVLPEAVLSDKDGILSLNYGNAALVVILKLAEKVIELENRLLKLEA
jgi:hypothetical protein